MYEERASRLDGAVVWTRTGTREDRSDPYPVLPDGRMDLLWTGGRLLVAGADTRAHVPQGPSTRYRAGVRFAPGTAPAPLGVPAREPRDPRVETADLWSPAEARRLTARPTGAADPAAAPEAVALGPAAGAGPPDRLPRPVVGALEAGRTVAATADAVGLSARRLHRRALDAFGYGPKTPARVLRLQRAPALVRRGVPYADAALGAGRADQAHPAREVREPAGLTLGGYPAPAKRETSQPSGSSTTA
ncbi:AraC family transcriptional regulator [Streptomyces sp. NPDC012623]|uniref:AraC family transcriptional regulator n=1 Tax=unclassified Streptomyces TaxID=2593676 RepID=UPI0036933936